MNLFNQYAGLFGVFGFVFSFFQFLFFSMEGGRKFISTFYLRNFSYLIGCKYTLSAQSRIL